MKDFNFKYVELVIECINKRIINLEASPEYNDAVNIKGFNECRTIYVSSPIYSTIEVEFWFDQVRIYLYDGMEIKFYCWIDFSYGDNTLSKQLHKVVDGMKAAIPIVMNENIIAFRAMLASFGKRRLFDKINNALHEIALERTPPLRRGELFNQLDEVYNFISNIIRTN